MGGQQLLESKKPPEGLISMQHLWDLAAKDFESICGESLQKGEVKSFDDVQNRIRDAHQGPQAADEGDQSAKWAKAKSVGLESLKYLKMLVGAASQASSFVYQPSGPAMVSTNECKIDTDSRRGSQHDWLCPLLRL